MSYYEYADTPERALEKVYYQIIDILEKKLTPHADSRKLCLMIGALPRDEQQLFLFRWSRDLSDVMNQFIIYNDEAAEAELTYECMTKGYRAINQEIVITYLNPAISSAARDAIEAYQESLRQLRDWYHHKLHQEFEEKASEWWDALAETPGCFGEHEVYVDALRMAFNEAYVNFDLLEQILSNIRRIVR